MIVTANKIIAIPRKSIVCVYSFEVVKKYIKNGNIKTRLNNFTCSALTSTKISDSINLTDKQVPIVYLYERYVAACLFLVIRALYTISSCKSRV